MTKPQGADAHLEETIARGVELFNLGRYFECHEIWESAWNELDGAERFCLQGLIQAAVALLHLERGNRRGAGSVFSKSRQKLTGCPPEFMGFKLAELVTQLDLIFEFSGTTSRSYQKPFLQKS
jgi:predicted metal-dependent hydrolase